MHKWKEMLNIEKLKIKANKDILFDEINGSNSLKFSLEVNYIDKWAQFLTTCSARKIGLHSNLYFDLFLQTNVF